MFFGQSEVNRRSQDRFDNGAIAFHRDHRVSDDPPARLFEIAMFVSLAFTTVTKERK